MIHRPSHDAQNALNRLMVSIVVLVLTLYEAALAHLGERQTEVHLSPALHAISGGTVFDPQKRHRFCF